MPHARKILIDRTRRKRHDPPIGSRGKIGLKIAHLHHHDILIVERLPRRLILSRGTELGARGGNDHMEVAFGDHSALSTRTQLIEQARNRTVQPHRLAGNATRHGTDRDIDLCAHARPDTGLNGSRVVQRGEHHAFSALPFAIFLKQRCQQHRGVVSTTRAGVVARIGKEEGARLCLECAPDRPARGIDRPHELKCGRLVPKILRDARGIGLNRHAIETASDHGSMATLLVSPRESHPHRSVENIILKVVCIQLTIKAPTRLDFGGRFLPRQKHRNIDLRAIEKSSGMLKKFDGRTRRAIDGPRLIDMRSRAIAREVITRIEKLIRYVTVRIHRTGYRHICTNDGADPRRKPALSVIKPLHRGSTMQIENHRIERGLFVSLRKKREKLLGPGMPEFSRNRTARKGMCIGKGNPIDVLDTRNGAEALNTGRVERRHVACDKRVCLQQLLTSPPPELSRPRTTRGEFGTFDMVAADSDSIGT